MVRKPACGQLQMPIMAPCNDETICTPGMPAHPISVGHVQAWMV
jgi:hypothetical protein